MSVPDPLVKNFVDASLTQMRRLNLMRWPGNLPESMRDPSIPVSNDWIGWRPIPSTATDADLDSLEEETGLPFPPLYRDLLKYLHFVELTGTALDFERHMCHNWKETLRKIYFNGWPRERILDIGLLPFGEESMMNAGPICFDTRHRDNDGDCPVVFWDHEWIGTDKEINPMFSSSRKMFECLSLVAAIDINFIYHGEDDDPDLIPQKQKFLTQFLALDLAGAGGPAREYWTCWGVTTAG